MEHAPTKAKVEAIRNGLSNGEMFADAVEHAEIFPSLYTRMVRLGSKTGTTDQALLKISRSYEDEIDTKLNTLLAVVEPTLVIILSVIVGVILLSVILPLLGIMTGIG